MVQPWSRFLVVLVVCFLLLRPSFSYNFCPSCGYKIAGSKFCSDCGAGPFGDEAQGAVKNAKSAKGAKRKIGLYTDDGEGEENIESFLPQFLEVRESEVSMATYKTESGFWFQSSGLLSTIGSTPLRSISSSTFETHLQSLRSRSCSIRTQQLHRSAYIAFLKYGNYLDKIDYSAEEVRMVKGRKGNKGKLRDEIVPFTSEEVGKLLEGASSPMHRCLFGLAVGLGLRPSEALNVRWEDFEDDKIRIRGTKTDMSDAIIPMTGLADREVERWREESKRHGSSFLAAKSHQDKSKRGFALKMTGGEGGGSGGGGGGKGSEGALPLPDGVTSRRKVKYVQIRNAVSDWSVSSAWERDFEDIATAAKYMNVSAATAKRVANNLQEHVAGWEVGYTTKLVDVYDENVAVKFGHANEQGMVGVTVLKVKKAGRAGGAAEAAEIVFKEKNAKEECAKYLNTTVKRIEKVLDGNAKTLKGHEIYWGTKLEKAFSMKKIVAPIGSYGAGGWGEEEDRGWEGKGGDNVELKGRLFVNAKNGEPIGSFKKALSTTCVKAEINYFEGRPRRVFPYLLRHSFATLAATSSPPVPIIVAQKVMRHSSSKLLLEVYARAGEGVVREGLSNFKL